MTDGSSDGGVTSVVYQLAAECTVEDIEAGECYTATVNGVVDYGVFVDLSDHVSGLLHESVLPSDYDDEYGVGDELVVELTEIRENGDLGFEVADLDDYEIEERAFSYERAAAGALDGRVGETVHLEGEVVQVKQTGGPTIFRVRDETGAVPCTAFEEAGVRAYPDIDLDAVVHVTGEVEEREGALQVEISALEELSEGEATHVRERLAAAVAERSEPADVDPLVEWPAMQELYPDLREVARQLRRTVLESRPIRMRHHADGDGMCASVPVQLALERFIDETHEDAEAKRHLLKRLPSKAPYYEMEDATRDLNFALEDQARHGQKLPLLLMLDNGSTEEDTPAYETLTHYDIPIVVVDHHHPDPEAVDPLVDAHVNPYLHGEDYRVTTGMMCVELARMIDPSLDDELDHVPAVAGISDRSKAEAMSDYLELAHDAGYTDEFLHDVSEALDYEAFWLRYSAGRDLINDVLNVGSDAERHRELVPWLAEKAQRDVDLQLDAAMPHVEHETVDSGAHLYRIDVENYAHRFTYPAPGKTTGEIHDRKVEETGEPVITIGYGPDFAVLRSDGVRMDIPQMVSDLNDEFPGAGVSGGGHLVVGSIRFVNGMREEVLDALVEKMADAEIDEELHSTLTR
ncbi:DHH family phosphoesterase [Halarchaeum sp. CBA1220]|uniref:DHH family phosphoesterase n=1 Tax=Halarchaeum sp. CBA1220 TaxID=1853682 RepID=UPI000F3A880D|nr:DHH family phosphoesterase [Halarchaeum sp. CBA1220]QLC34195.1 DHH family phosphoesterase [Halarchaeum sp. CBA1220]